MGFSLPIINTIFQTIIQTVVPPDKIGRVLSINSTLCMLMTPIGIILSGPFSVIFGITNLFLVCGIIGILITITTYLFSNIRHTDYERKIEIKIPEILE
jgi:MFS family permease